MSYLWWFDDGKRTPPSVRIREGAEAYEERFGVVPNVCLVSDKEWAGPAEFDGIEVRPVPWLRPHNYWLGRSIGDPDDMR